MPMSIFSSAFCIYPSTSESNWGYNRLPLPGSLILPKSPADQTSETPYRSHLRQLALQLSEVFIVLSLAWPFFLLHGEALPWPGTSLAIGGVAFLLAVFTRQTWWWRTILALFAPLAWGINSLSIDPAWFLLAFILLVLVYRGALTGQIPLYLSNAKTARELAEITAQHPTMRFLDLGAGIGSVLAPLAKMRRDAECTGYENAPLVWLLGLLRTMGSKNCRWRWGSFWNAELSRFDVVYAFLSPAPIAELWRKINREMQPSGLFISNSFSVPGVEPTRVVEIDDARRTKLYCYLLR